MTQVLKFRALIFTLAAFVVSSLVAFGQTRLKTTDISITKDKSKTVQPGCSRQTLTLAFGRPMQMKTYNFEMDKKMGYEVLYDGANFYFEENKLMGFEIRKAGFNIALGHPGVITAVGKNIADLPQGYTTRCRDNRCAKVYDLKRDDKVTTDKFLEYDYGQNNQKVIKKIIWGDY